MCDAELLRSFNPTVWGAVTRFARVAAFFHYVHAHRRRAWDRFAARMRRVRFAPRVETPTVILRD